MIMAIEFISFLLDFLFINDIFSSSLQLILERYLSFDLLWFRSCLLLLKHRHGMVDFPITISSPETSPPKKKDVSWYV